MKKPTFNRRTDEFQFNKLCKWREGRFHRVYGGKSCLEQPINNSQEHRDLSTAQQYQILAKTQCRHSWNAEFLYISSRFSRWRVDAFFLKLYFLRFIAVIGTRFKEMLGKTACKHEVEHESWKNAATGEIENHQMIPREMVFWVWWHLSGNFVLLSTREGRVKISSKTITRATGT